jgi:hypothetical protein
MPFSVTRNSVDGFGARTCFSPEDFSGLLGVWDKKNMCLASVENMPRMGKDFLQPAGTECNSK